MSREALPLRAGTPGSVSASTTRVGGREVVDVKIDPSVRRGALTPADGELLRTAVETALDARVPLIGSIASSGADINEGIAALHGWGMAARAMTTASGVVPMILSVDGPAVSGPALLLGLADQVVMTEDAYAFVSGPQMVRQFTGVGIEADALGGAAAHARSSGVAALVTATPDAAREAVCDLLSYLPAHVDEVPPRRPSSDPADRRTPELAELMPDRPTGSYEVRDVIRAIADDGEILELRQWWAPNLVTALVGVAGRPVGVVANQPGALSGTLDITASDKGAGFVAFCDAFGLPLLTLVDTPGFSPGKDQEWRGMIRHGAQLAFAYARATVPRVCVALRKVYGGAYIVMGSKAMGNDVYLAWPTSEIAVMGATQAAEILYRREDPETRARLEDDYAARLLNPYIAAARGSVDAVIDPADTRREVATAFGLLETKQERLPKRRHDNIPL